MNFDDVSGETTPLRSKENAHDYRYFPDPDLKPLIVTKEDVLRIQSTMYLPDVVRQRYSDSIICHRMILNLFANRQLFDF